MRYVKLASYVKLSVYKHDRAQSAQRIQVVSLFCFVKQNLSWDYFSFILTQLVEVIMRLVQYAETIGWGLRVYVQGLGSGLMVKVRVKL